MEGICWGSEQTEEPEGKAASSLLTPYVSMDGTLGVRTFHLSNGSLQVLNEVMVCLRHSFHSTNICLTPATCQMLFLLLGI